MSGPKEGFNFDGIQTKGLYVVLPFVGDTTWGMSFVACDNVVLTCLIAERHYMEQPELFLQILDRNIQTFLDQAIDQTSMNMLSQKLGNVMEGDEERFGECRD